MVTIRDAVPGDARVLAEAQRAIARTPGLLASTPSEIDEADLRRDIESDRAKFVVAEDGGAIVGHARLRRYALARASHVVDLVLAVHEGHQGRGVGRLLMHGLIEWARASPDVEKIELRVRATNTRAVTLYASLGFVVEGRFARRIKLAADHYVDDIAMALFTG